MAEAERTPSNSDNLSNYKNRLAYVKARLNDISMDNEQRNIIMASVADWFMKEIRPYLTTGLYSPATLDEEDWVIEFMDHFVKVFDPHLYEKKEKEGGEENANNPDLVFENEQEILNSFFAFYGIKNPEELYDGLRNDKRYTAIASEDQQTRKELFPWLVADKLESYLMPSLRASAKETVVPVVEEVHSRIVAVTENPGVGDVIKIFLQRVKALVNSL